jgi:ribonuclease BN (tRNA processing enzyme)
VLAHEAHVGQLLLSHLSPATDTQSDTVRASIAENFQGAVQFAQDGDRLGF